MTDCHPNAERSPSTNEHGVVEPTARGHYWIRDRHGAWVVVHRIRNAEDLHPEEVYVWSTLGGRDMECWRDVGAREVVGPIDEPAPERE